MRSLCSVPQRGESRDICRDDDVVQLCTSSRAPRRGFDVWIA